MIIYVGLTRKKTFVEALRERGIGRILQRGECHLQALYPGERWCFDNGAFSDWINKREFDDDAFLVDLARIVAAPVLPQFVVCPDKPADPDSLAFSLRWRRKMPECVRVYLAVQDGMQEREVGTLLHKRKFDGLFIGGSDAFKQTAPEWAGLAHAYGVPCHYGRASTPAKLMFARTSGCDSADSSFPLWEAKRFWRWLATGSGAQRDLYVHGG